MANFCLLPKYVDQFKQGLINKEIDAQGLSNLSSKERRTFLEKYVGKDNAEQVNALFESKLLLQNQRAGYISWAKKVANLSPQAKRDLISRIERMDKVLSPTEEKAFLEDLAKQKLGVGVSMQEANTISDLSKKVQDAQSKQSPDFTFSNEKYRLSYGRAQVDLYNYVNDLKIRAKSKFTLNPLKLTNKVASNAKAIKASLDDSAIFRQGWKTLWTHPLTWAKNSVNSLSNLVRTFGGKPVMDEINADIISRPNALNNFYKRARLAVGTVEEQFPTSLPEKVPLLGRLYKSSEVAYTGFVHKTRADIFDKYIQIAQKKGVELNDKELRAIGSMVNSLTGRATFPGDLERAAGVINNVFFSPRYVKSEIDTLGHVITGAGGSNFVRKQAAINLIRVVGGTAAVLATAGAILPGSVETDPRSTDFGKIKIGNTRFDVSGGMASIITLASRLITQSSKSSITGAITPLNTGKFGAPTSKDVVINYLENKLSPVASVVKDLLEGKDFQGNKPTFLNETKNLFEPLVLSNYEELSKDPNAADTLVAMIADGLGIATNTYTKTPKDWSQEPTKAQKAFLDKVGESKFKEANNKFNDAYQKWFDKTVKSDSYKNLGNEEKATVLTNGKKKIQDNIFKDYHFTYEKAQPTRKQEQNKKVIKSLLP